MHATVVRRASDIPGWMSLRRGAGWLSQRENRVVALTLLVALLSVTDLIITLTYLQTIGMSEANPIARLVMSYNSPSVLIAWKLATIALTSLIFFVGRRKRVAELGCWVCVAVLVWLTVRWETYAHEVSKVTPVIHVLASGDCPGWVSMPQDQ